MKSLLAKLTRLLSDDAGPTAVEYAAMLMLVMLACLTGITVIGQSTATRYQNSNTAIEKAVQERP